MSAVGYVSWCVLWVVVVSGGDDGVMLKAENFPSMAKHIFKITFLKENIL